MNFQMILLAGTEIKEGPQQVVCYRAWDGTGLLDLEERREVRLHSGYKVNKLMKKNKKKSFRKILS